MFITPAVEILIRYNSFDQTVPRYYCNLKKNITLLCLVLGVSVFPLNQVFAQNIDNTKTAQLFRSDSAPFGTPYNEWTSKWWMWLISVPLFESPAADTTGQYCAKNQAGPVWFLAGTFQGLAERACDIPADRAILLPVFNVECSFAEFPNLKTDSELSQCAKESIDKVTLVQASVDGVEIQNIKNNRTQSPAFNVTFPEQNIFGVQAGPTRAVSDGFWVFLQPLSTGMHEIKFKGALVDYTTTSIATITNDVTYHLNVTAVPGGLNQTQPIVPQR
ncbi:MAG TPA: hypothetical protein VJ695_10090 [Nitrososphaera sp.]|nr:hypothetical protein [Nitrososphaera sp.]